MPDFVIVLADCSVFSVFLFYSVLILFSALRRQGRLQCQLQSISGMHTGNSTVQKSVSRLCSCVIADNGVVLVMTRSFYDVIVMHIVGKCSCFCDRHAVCFSVEPGTVLLCTVRA